MRQRQAHVPGEILPGLVTPAAACASLVVNLLWLAIRAGRTLLLAAVR
jgi:hypothetical protein